MSKSKQPAPPAGQDSPATKVINKPRRAQVPAAAGSKPLPLQSLVQITWLDAAFDLDEEPKDLILVTVGWLMRQNADFVVVAGEASPKMDYFRSYTKIPCSLVQSIRRLAVAE